MLWAQQIAVKGVVLDESNEPIIGASVVETGTTNGTITDFDGAFTLNVKANGAVQVSYVGYLTQTAQVHGQPAVNVVAPADRGPGHDGGRLAAGRRGRAAAGAPGPEGLAAGARPRGLAGGGGHPAR
ncbi:MAG: carboxypeptidase-like regulatory domain-containing protein, partial [Elusimicrobiaceae bacterium]|nr:carboxypeptidase-like regulatory domain-containing protein [Elusimicrobiaceae bacterium]